MNSTIKKTIRLIVSQNSYVNQTFDRLAFGKETSHVRGIQDLLASDDSIADVSLLRSLRRKIDENDYKWFTKDINFNNCSIYGIWQSLFPEASINDCVYYPCIEHGLFLYNYVFGDVYATARPAVATFSDYRFNILRKKTNLPVFRVGPYVQYAHGFYDEDKAQSIHKRNGRTLLLFPRHSTNDSELSVDNTRYLKQLREVARRYSHVIVCCFWWNINDPLIEQLKAEGYQVVSAGFRDDPLFLSRLKTIIALCDYAVGDSVGTHIGYCCQMGIEYRIIELGSQNHDKDPLHNRIYNTMEEHEVRIRNAFIGDDNHEKENVARYYYGVGLREDLDAVAKICRDIVTETRGFKVLMSTAVKNCLKIYDKYGNYYEKKSCSPL